MPERFRTRELQPLGSRIRTRLVLQPLEKAQLRDLLEHLLDRAGNPGLVTEPLKDVLIKHSAGNPRVLCNLCADLLSAAVEQDLPRLDDELFLKLFGRAGAA